MSEPRRLRDEGPEDVRDLLRAGRATRAMSPGERARTKARVARYASAAAIAAALSWLPGAALGAGLGVAVVAVGWGVPALMSRWSAPPAERVVKIAPPVAPPVAPPPEPTAEPLSAPVVPRPAITVASPASVASAAPPEEPPVDPLAEEVALLDRARAALGSRPAAALAITDEHAARFPRGKLAMERELVAIDALRRLGRRGDARARGEAILERARGSLYEQRIRALIEGGP